MPALLCPPAVHMAAPFGPSLERRQKIVPDDFYGSLRNRGSGCLRADLLGVNYRVPGSSNADRWHGKDYEAAVGDSMVPCNA